MCISIFYTSSGKMENQLFLLFLPAVFFACDFLPVLCFGQEIFKNREA